MCYDYVDTSEHVLAVRSVLSATGHTWPLRWLLGCCFSVVGSKSVEINYAFLFL